MTESVNDIERDIEATRTRLFDTIERIQDRLTVSGIVDEVMGQAGVPRAESGHDFVLGLLRRHPLPVMIAAAGLGFLVYRQSRKRATLTAREIHDAEFVEVPVVTTGQARVYDPDTSPRHPGADLTESRRALEAQA